VYFHVGYNQTPVKSNTSVVIVQLLLLLLFTSCYSTKDITRNKPITRDFLAALEPGKRYAFELSMGQIQRIYVTAVDDGRVVGYLYPNGYNKKDKVAFADDFENIAKNVVKISERKIDPMKTTIAILVPIAIAIWINEAGAPGLTF
jgi:hypothetical protein